MAKNIFESVQFSKPKSNKFDLSHEKKLSIKFNNLYPIFHQEIVPGDSMKVSSEIFVRMAPMLSPVMHRVNVFTHYFFIPNRIVWEDWEEFITGGEQGTSTPVFPTLLIDANSKGSFRAGRLPDYFGIPPIPLNDTDVVPHNISALPFRAMAEIYNEYFRDQNLEAKIPYQKSSTTVGQGQELLDLTELRQRAWEKDYFTSALPWSQRGGEATIPLGKVAPNYKSTSITATDAGQVPSTGAVNINQSINGRLEDSANQPIRIENLDPMDVDATTINELRKANKLQEWLEKSARGGSRYAEQLLSFFGVRSDDARLQRPEYLGGGKQPLVISEVLNTTGTTEAPQGDMAGHGISVGGQNRFNKKFKEHGQIIGIMSVIPKTAYQNGISKDFTKFDKFDYYFPEFANLGEQELHAQEIYCNFKDETAKTRVFGYQQRYAEYKYKESSVHGNFRDSLQFWHLGRVFTTEPVLNESFIHADARTNIFAVTDGQTDYLWCQIYNKVSAIRPMPYFSIPEL